MSPTLPPPVPDLIDRARDALDRGDRATASACLDAALRLAPACLAAHNLREAHALPGHYGAWMGVKAAISPDDDIFRFFAHHPTSAQPLRDYLADGWRSLAELHRALDASGRSLFRQARVLEFASGHGRFTRHLAEVLPPGALTVSDIVPGAVDFLRQHWPVDGFDSCADPARLEAPGRFDLVFVLSLFSHLPASTWTAWLQRLWDLVAPGGVLVFSTHGLRCAEDAGLALPEDGFLFFASSESQALDGQAYGTSFTAPAWVERAIASLGPAPARVLHRPTLFWGRQDAFLVEKA